MSQNDPFGPEKFDAYQEPESAAPPPEHKGPGCLFWGCLISGILALVTVVLVVALVFFVRGKLVDVMREYTAPEPVELPEVQIAEERRQEVVTRWEDFREALEAGRPAEVVLDSDEFNVVAQQEFPEAAERVYFTIEGDKLRGQISVPVEELGRKILRTGQLDGRYFNASGTFDAFVRNGIFHLHLQEAEVKGDPVPEEAMSQIRNENLAENMSNDPEQRELFARLDSLTIEDGRIIITARGEGEPAADPADADAAEPALPEPAEPGAEAPEAPSDTTVAPEPAEPEARGDAPAAPEPTEAPATPAEPGDEPAEPSQDEPASEPETEPETAAA